MLLWILRCTTPWCILSVCFYCLPSIRREYDLSPLWLQLTLNNNEDISWFCFVFNKKSERRMQFIDSNYLSIANRSRRALIFGSSSCLWLFTWWSTEFILAKEAHTVAILIIILLPELVIIMELLLVVIITIVVIIVICLIIVVLYQILILHHIRLQYKAETSSFIRMFESYSAVHCKWVDFPWANHNNSTPKNDLYHWLVVGHRWLALMRVRTLVTLVALAVEVIWTRNRLWNTLRLDAFLKSHSSY